VLTGFPNYPQGKLYAGYKQQWSHLERTGDRSRVRRVPLYPSHSSSSAGRAVNYLSFGLSARMQAGEFLADRDAVWVYNSPAPVGAVARQVARRRGVPYLVHVMDVWPDSVLESGMLAAGPAHRLAETMLSRVVTRTHEAASLIAVTSPGQEELLRSRGVPAAKLRYIPVWANEDVFFPREIDRSLLPEAARGATTVVMYAGAMGHVQRLDAAIRAAAKAGEALHLVMVGGGVAEAGLRELTRELGAANVHFMGSQPADRMGALTAAADVHLVSLADTPLLRVTMPSKIQSIMAAARPIVATCAGDAAEVVERAGAGVAVTPGNEQELLSVFHSLTEPSDQLQSWGESGRRYYEAEFAKFTAVSRVETALRETAATI
jgi:glycosyltransferase involved in cell wall biosynthesis